MNAEKTNNPPLMLGIRETAELFGITPHYARQLALSGAVRAVKVGRDGRSGKILINIGSLTEFFEKSSIPDQMKEGAMNGT